MAKIAEVREVSPTKLKFYERNAKIHGKDQIEKLKNSIEEFGFLSPCLIDREYNLIAGHGRVMAALELGMETVPCVFVEGLSEAQRRAYILADNKLGELASWDDFLLQQELEELSELIDIELTGFELEDDQDQDEESGAEGQINLTQALPESKVYIYTVSAFGTDSEKIVMIKLPQQTADHILEAIEEQTVPQIVEKLVGALNEL